MGLEALTRDADGHRIVPRTEVDWRDWVSATATRKHALSDPLLDWLSLYGRERGFQPDNELEGYDERTDFGRFIMRKGTEFEAAVVAYLGTMVPLYTVETGPEGSRALAAAEETFDAMRRGREGIYQAVLRDAVSRTYGVADLLIRSDHLHRLSPGSVAADAASIPAPDLGGQPWHYRVVDIKYTTLHFLADWGLGDSGGSIWAYKVQVYMYNRALGRLQGYVAPEAHLLGRGWERTAKAHTERGLSCLDRLGAVPHDHVSRSRGVLAMAADEACAWLRRLRAEGASWGVLPEPSVPELRPHMTSSSADLWHSASQDIGRRQGELTQLWQVGVEKRRVANRAGILRWSDPACTSQALGVTGETVGPTLQAILEVNRSTDGPSIRPARVHAAEEEWREEPPLEFYVDFETVSDLDDDFSSIPQKGGQPLIFMIGCGHVDDGAWRWACFTADALSEQCEAGIIDGWFAHMDAVRQRLDPDGAEPRVFHWSHAEQSTFEMAFNSAKKRHPDRGWESPRWFDSLKRVVKEEPVVVRGAFGFGLKAVAKAMHANGHIATSWGAGPTDGMGAMVGAWSCALEAAERRCTLPETKLMGEIALYNEVDCKVMMEVVRYLRDHH